jgi:pimeloyl-ACP methyl ester carboxylesterase
MAGNDGPSDAVSAEYLVTLVHGTFATSAPWMKDESTLSETLRQRLGVGLTLVPFNWSGRNSPKARLAAADCLATRLARQVREHPDAKHYIVSHSHGGAVALRAAVKSGVLDRIAGIVCMATPFLVARDRDLGRGRTETYVGIILAAAFGGPPILDALLAPLPWSDTLRFIVKGAVLMAVIMTVMLSVQKWQAAAQRLLERLTFDPIDPRKVLIVRTPADEASGFLIVGQFVSQLTVRVYLGAQRLVAQVEAAAHVLSRRRWVLTGLAVGEFVVMFLFLIAFAEASNRGLAPWLATLGLAGFYVSVIALIFTVVLFVPGYGVPGVTTPFRILVSFLTWPTIAILSLFLALPFGWEVALANILLDVTAETTPTGSWTVHMFPAPTAKELDTDAVPLMHSVVYENPRALAFIAKWIEPEQRGENQRT